MCADLATRTLPNTVNEHNIKRGEADICRSREGQEYWSGARHRRGSFRLVILSTHLSQTGPMLVLQDATPILYLCH